ncbi:MAG: rod shape-determining protein RodA [Saprospiraceae bacterium]
MAIGLNQRTNQSVDWITLSIFVALIAVGWFMIYAVGYGNTGYSQDLGEFLFQTQIGRQSIWLLISFIFFLLLMTVDWQVWRTVAYFIYVVGIILLLLVPFLGKEINGQKAWFAFGWFTFQPAELAKFGTALALSSYLNSSTNRLQSLQSRLIAMGIFLLPIGLILLQPDAGSALVFLSFFIVLFREGFSPTPYIVGLVIILLFVVTFKYEPFYVSTVLVALSGTIFINQFRLNKFYWWLVYLAFLSLIAAGIYYQFYWSSWIINIVVCFSIGYWQYSRNKLRGNFPIMAGLLLCVFFSFTSSYLTNNVLQDHQRTRIKVWLKPEECDPQGELYNVLQSKMAIGGGGLTGKGYLEGPMTKLNYVPEQSTDFIFCTIGEEQGFVGSSIIILLFVILLYRIINIAERQRANFSRYYAYCIAGILFVHFSINIGMTLGFFPIIGIPLPFISKGGTSLLGFTTMMAVLLKLDSNRYSI